MTSSRPSHADFFQSYSIVNADSDIVTGVSIYPDEFLIAISPLARPEERVTFLALGTDLQDIAADRPILPSLLDRLTPSPCRRTGGRFWLRSILQ